MILTNALKDGKRNTLLELAESLQAIARKSAAEGVSLDVVERLVKSGVMEMGRATVDLFIELQGDGDLGETVQSVDRHVTTPEKIIEALFRDGAPRQRSDRPIPRFKHVAAFFPTTHDLNGKILHVSQCVWKATKTFYAHRNEQETFARERHCESYEARFVGW